MRQEIISNRNNVIINFTLKYCNTSEDLLDSSSFKKILCKYLTLIEKKDTPVFKYLSSNIPKEEMTEDIIKIFKLLIVFSKKDISEMESNYSKILENKELMIEFIEGLYSYWRKFERYAIIKNTKSSLGLQNVNFIESMNNFTNLILKTYRQIEETILEENHRVYRQLIAGVNAGIILNDHPWKAPSEYIFLKNIPFIESVILQPPFITYPKRNTRKGIFNEVFENPLENLEVNYDNWICYPAKVGNLLAFVYFNINFMAQGITLCNLFELAKKEDYENKKPDIIYMYGVKDFDSQMKTEFYKDSINDIMVGYANYNEDIDYFGYMKKMILTLHNLKMIEKGYLPIHGAMVNITMKNEKIFNVVIMGDSGAGKSESLEAFRVLSENYIKDMKVIFDDMGFLKISKSSEKPLGYGTEIGAFVRLDDLDTGYSYKELDRSIFMNPDKINSRIIIPVATYDDITKGYPVDIFLYANNYEKGDEITFFRNSDEAIPVFIDGARMAKGTTNETGLVKSFFANPFGPVQRKDETSILIKKYFDKMFEKNILVGQIRTCLGIEGLEKDGPKKAAKKLFDIIMEM